MLSFISNWLRERNRLRDIMRTIGRVGIHSYLVDGDKLSLIVESYLPGDAIITYAVLSASSIVQGGRYSHASIGTGAGTIVDATPVNGLTKRTILAPLIGCGRVAIRRPRLTGTERLAIAERAIALSSRGIEYDWNFDPNNVAMYCSEAYRECVEYVVPGSIALREHFSVMSYTPDDIAEDDFFETIIEFSAEAIQ